jgi:hypothetical protein
MSDDDATPGRTGEPIEAPTDRIRRDLVEFVRALRAAGATVPTNATLPAARALAEVGLADRGRARIATRAALLTRPDDRALFDRLFDRFWSRLRDHVESPLADEEGSDAGGLEPPTLESAGTTGSEADSETPERDVTFGDAGTRRGVTDADATDADDAPVATYSPAGGSRRIDRRPAEEDGDRTEAVTRRLTRALADAAGRRTERADVGRRVDARTALRESVATGGAAMSLPRRRPKRTAVRGVLIADVSRSVLDVVDRDFLIRFARALRGEWRSARIFLFDTDVREVTGAFDADSDADAYDALERAEAEWGGGTRIGHALTTVRDRYPAAVDRRTVVLVVSDGLEMGDVSELAGGIAWIASRARLVLWLNPLAAGESFEPTASGMAAAEPHVDGIFPFAGAEDVEEMARQIERYSGREPIGYRQDRRTRT